MTEAEIIRRAKELIKRADKRIYETVEAIKGSNLADVNKIRWEVIRTAQEGKAISQQILKELGAKP